MYTVLVCDDERDIVSALKIYLTGAGYRVLEAYNGEEALTLIGSESVQLVLLDIMMPEMDGYQTMQHIREEPAHRRLPIIALTAKAMKGDREKCIEAGATDYVSKPVDPEYLLTVLQVWLYR